jgi:hypothetical protein
MPLHAALAVVDPSLAQSLERLCLCELAGRPPSMPVLQLVHVDVPSTVEDMSSTSYLAPSFLTAR